MSVVGFFVVTPNWKQPKCPSSAEWINKSEYKQAMEYSSLIKRNKPLKHVTTRKIFKNFMLS